MAPHWRRRSTRDARMWKCKANQFENHPQRLRLFDMPRSVCGCGCGERYNGDLEFCMADIKVNGHGLLGSPYDQGTENECVSHAYGKTLEISRRVKELLQGRDPNSVPKMDPVDLTKKYNNRMKGKASNGMKRVVNMGLILKEEGMLSEDGSTLYKVSNVSSVRQDDPEAMARYLADGFPLHGGILVGRSLRFLKYCQSYIPPRRSKFYAKKRKPVAHAIVLVGAGRKKGKWHFFFMNSWKGFCRRRNSFGTVIREGIGKISAGRMWRNPVRLSRFKEERTERSLARQDTTELSAHNYHLIASDEI